MPPDTNMVFVVILHLSPDFESTLAKTIQHSTKMKVLTAVDRVKVEANCVYVIPRGKHLTAVNGHLRLNDFESERGRRVAVDLFFRSLADTHGPHAAAVVLSGVDGDGAVGIKRIKERGGLTIAQDPNEAGHGGMPRAAIDTGMVDWVLNVSEMPRRVLSYFSQEKALKLPPEDGPQPAKTTSPTRSRPAAERGSFDVLVSDLGLPDGSGYEVMAHVREARRIPGIAMSGYGMDEDVRRSHEAGFTEHLVKPIEITQLVAAIDRVAENRG